jgi:hypothetical protein
VVKFIKFVDRFGKIKKRYLLLPIAITMISGVAVASALFTQTFPAVGSTPVLTAGCSTLTAEITAPPTTGSSSSNGILFDCVASPGAAFVAIAGTATPTFTLPAGFTGLYISGSGSCAGPTALEAISLTSGTPVTFSNPEYAYCATYSSWPNGGTTTFTITWN